MNTSIEKLFKYGSFDSEETNRFNTIEQLDKHLERLRLSEDKDPVLDDVQKWTLEVSASNGVQFTINLDL